MYETPNPYNLYALLQSYVSSAAASAVTDHSGVPVTALGHCQALPYDTVPVAVIDLYQMWKIPEQMLQAVLTSALI